jgi:hypothetical protein
MTKSKGKFSKKAKAKHKEMDLERCSTGKRSKKLDKIRKYKSA